MKNFNEHVPTRASRAGLNLTQMKFWVLHYQWFPKLLSTFMGKCRREFFPSQFGLSTHIIKQNYWLCYTKWSKFWQKAFKLCTTGTGVKSYIVQQYVMLCGLCLLYKSLHCTHARSVGLYWQWYGGRRRIPVHIP